MSQRRRIEQRQAPRDRRRRRPRYARQHGQWCALPARSAVAAIAIVASAMRRRCPIGSVRPNFEKADREADAGRGAAPPRTVAPAAPDEPPVAAEQALEHAPSSTRRSPQWPSSSACGCAAETPDRRNGRAGCGSRRPASRAAGRRASPAGTALRSSRCTISVRSMKMPAMLGARMAISSALLSASWRMPAWLPLLLHALYRQRERGRRHQHGGDRRGALAEAVADGEQTGGGHARHFVDDEARRIEADPAERAADDQRNAVAQRVCDDLPVDRPKAAAVADRRAARSARRSVARRRSPQAATPADWPNSLINTRPMTNPTDGPNTCWIE